MTKQIKKQWCYKSEQIIQEELNKFDYHLYRNEKYTLANIAKQIHYLHYFELYTCFFNSPCQHSRYQQYKLSVFYQHVLKIIVIYAVAIYKWDYMNPSIINQIMRIINCTQVDIYNKTVYFIKEYFIFRKKQLKIFKEMPITQKLGKKVYQLLNAQFQLIWKSKTVRQLLKLEIQNFPKYYAQMVNNLNQQNIYKMKAYIKFNMQKIQKIIKVFPQRKQINFKSFIDRHQLYWQINANYDKNKKLQDSFKIERRPSKIAKLKSWISESQQINPFQKFAVFVQIVQETKMFYPMIDIASIYLNRISSKFQLSVQTPLQFMLGLMNPAPKTTEMQLSQSICQQYLYDSKFTSPSELRSSWPFQKLLFCQNNSVSGKQKQLNKQQHQQCLVQNYLYQIPQKYLPNNKNVYQNQLIQQLGSKQEFKQSQQQQSNSQYDQILCNRTISKSSQIIYHINQQIEEINIKQSKHQNFMDDLQTYPQACKAFYDKGQMQLQTQHINIQLQKSLVFRLLLIAYQILTGQNLINKLINTRVLPRKTTLLSVLTQLETQVLENSINLQQFIPLINLNYQQPFQFTLSSLLDIIQLKQEKFKQLKKLSTLKLKKYFNYRFITINRILYFLSHRTYFRYILNAKKYILIYFLVVLQELHILDFLYKFQINHMGSIYQVKKQLFNNLKFIYKKQHKNLFSVQSNERLKKYYQKNQSEEQKRYLMNSNAYKQMQYIQQKLRYIRSIKNQLNQIQNKYQNNLAYFLRKQNYLQYTNKIKQLIAAIVTIEQKCKNHLLGLVVNQFLKKNNKTIIMHKFVREENVQLSQQIKPILSSVINLKLILSIASFVRTSQEKIVLHQIFIFPLLFKYSQDKNVVKYQDFQGVDQQKMSKQQLQILQKRLVNIIQQFQWFQIKILQKEPNPHQYIMMDNLNKTQLELQKLQIDQVDSFVREKHNHFTEQQQYLFQEQANEIIEINKQEKNQMKR